MKIYYFIYENGFSYSKKFISKDKEKLQKEWKRLMDNHDDTCKYISEIKELNISSVTSI